MELAVDGNLALPAVQRLEGQQVVDGRGRADTPAAGMHEAKAVVLPTVGTSHKR